MGRNKNKKQSTDIWKRVNERKETEKKNDLFFFKTSTFEFQNIVNRRLEKVMNASKHKKH